MRSPVIAAKICPSAIPALIAALSNRDALLVTESTLARIGELAVPALASALMHEDETVRVRAATALHFIGRDAKLALPALINALEDSAVRPFAAEALRSICGEEQDAIPLRWAHLVSVAFIDRGWS